LALLVILDQTLETKAKLRIVKVLLNQPIEKTERRNSKNLKRFIH